MDQLDVIDFLVRFAPTGYAGHAGRPRRCHVVGSPVWCHVSESRGVHRTSQTINPITNLTTHPRPCSMIQPDSLPLLIFFESTQRGLNEEVNAYRYRTLINVEETRVQVNLTLISRGTDTQST